MSGDREVMLSRIRDALADVTRNEDRGTSTIPRTYRQGTHEPTDTVVERFVERVRDYRASVIRVSRDRLPNAVAEALRARSVHHPVIPGDLPVDWLPPDMEPIIDNNLSNGELDGSDGVITGCALAIAETGTIVLDGGPQQGRRAITLIPDYHLCIVQEDQIVDLVPQAISRLHDAAREGFPITFISGPSATSDIELSRIEGVHGPRTLEVLVVK